MITLDESTHVYSVDGRPVGTNVSALLEYACLVDKTWFTTYGKIRGQLTHKAIKFFNDNVLDEDDLDPALEPYFRAYVRFLVDSGFVVTGSEIKVYDEVYDYAGTIDIEGYFKWSPNILYDGDTKCNKVYDWTGVQVSLYRKARGGFRRGFAVELHSNGTYKINWFRDQPYYDRTAAQILRKWREEHNGNGADH